MPARHWKQIGHERDGGTDGEGAEGAEGRGPCRADGSLVQANLLEDEQAGRRLEVLEDDATKCSASGWLSPRSR